jgi:hypothetical protein
MSLAAVKAAAAYTDAINSLPGWQATLKLAGSPYYSGSGTYAVEVTTPNSGVFTIKFKRPVTSGTRGWGARQADKIDAAKNFNMQADWVAGKRPAGVSAPKERRTYGSYGASGTFFDDTTEVLDKSGFLQALMVPGSEAKLDKAIKKGRQIDSRISFISDPGRWALAAGYDNMTVPSSRFNIFLHRTAFVTKK